MPQLPEYLYLGGAPHDMLMFHDTDLTIPAHGLRGCILSFVLAEAELDLFGEAVTGQDIIECDSAVCASLPCHNNGVCNQVYTGLWSMVRVKVFTCYSRTPRGPPGSVTAPRGSQGLYVSVRCAQLTLVFMAAPALASLSQELASSVSVLTEEEAPSVRRASACISPASPPGWRATPPS